MWSREELKARGWTAVKRNYWRCVLVALVLAFFVETGNSGNNNSDNSGGIYSENWDTDEAFSDGDSWDENDEEADGEVWNSDGAEYLGDDETVFDRLSDGVSLVQNRKVLLKIGAWKFFRTGLSVMLVWIVVVALIFLHIFVFSLLEIGGCRFFIENADGPVPAGRMLSVFKDGQYGKMVLTQFLRGLYTFLWSLLLVIPGIVKSYEYLMMPYLLADFPELNTDEVFQISKEMMDGNKLDAFVLDLSFILWELLSAVTLGIAGIFWVCPYEYATRAELYLTLKEDYFKTGTEDTY